MTPDGHTKRAHQMKVRLLSRILCRGLAGMRTACHPNREARTIIPPRISDTQPATQAKLRSTCAAALACRASAGLAAAIPAAAVSPGRVASGCGPWQRVGGAAGSGAARAASRSSTAARSAPRAAWGSAAAASATNIGATAAACAEAAAASSGSAPATESVAQNPWHRVAPQCTKSALIASAFYAA